MTEAGMLSIVRCGTTYQVRDASSNPHAMDRQPYPCPDEGTLVGCDITVGWGPGLSIGCSPNCGTGGWLCRPLSFLRCRGRGTSHALPGDHHDGVLHDGLERHGPLPSGR